MSIRGSDLSRWMLAVVLITTAWLMAKHFLIEQDWALVLPFLNHPLLMGSLVAFEVACGVLLFSRYTVVAGWAVVGLSTAGALVGAYARFMYGGGVSCGCMGRVPLSYWQHGALSAIVFVLAAHSLTEGRRLPPEAS